jgi:hypothetical protein
VYREPGTALVRVYRPVPSAPFLSVPRFFTPPGQTIWALPTSRMRNASGAGDLTVTVPVVSSPVAVAPGGTHTPRRLEPFFGLAMKLMFAATSLAVSGVPSPQVTPFLRV